MITTTLRKGNLVPKLPALERWGIADLQNVYIRTTYGIPHLITLRLHPTLRLARSHCADPPESTETWVAYREVLDFIGYTMDITPEEHVTIPKL